ncbi:MAG TPA: hypothetical protein VMT52_13175 [Planctomycetota bacterium]|nr:hypothetical protein [Planctomycetota bacterium]
MATSTHQRFPMPPGDARPPYRGLLLVLYFAVFWILILLPFELRVPPPVGSALGAEIQRLRTSPASIPIELFKSLGHAFLFFPLAPILAWGKGAVVRHPLSPGILALAILLAASSEAVQPTVGRGATITDFVMDLAGLGAGVIAVSLTRRSRHLRVLLGAFASLASAILLILGVGVLSFFVLRRTDRIPFGPAGLESWDPAHSLLLGNTASRSRPWLGVLERVTIGDGEADLVSYAFSTRDVALGPGGDVREVHGSPGPLLVAQRGSDIELAGGGIELVRPSLLSSPEPLLDAAERIRESGAFTLEVRLRPRDLDQRGPARIVSLASPRGRPRNFSLAQEKGALELRIRSALTGLDGGLELIRVKDAFPPGRSVMVRATYEGGLLLLFIDEELRGKRDLNLLGWASHHLFGAGLTPRVAAGAAFVAWAVNFILAAVICARLGVEWRKGLALAAAAALALVTLVVVLAAPSIAHAADTGDSGSVAQGQRRTGLFQPASLEAGGFLAGAPGATSALARIGLEPADESNTSRDGRDRGAPREPLASSGSLRKSMPAREVQVQFPTFDQASRKPACPGVK